MLNLRRVGTAIRHSFAIDTNVASYALDGELWCRSRIDLIPYIKLMPGVTNMDEVAASLPVKRATACFNWVKRQDKVVSITPTVVNELLMAKQVRRFTAVYTCLSLDIIIPLGMFSV